MQFELGATSWMESVTAKVCSTIFDVLHAAPVLSAPATRDSNQLAGSGRNIVGVHVLRLWYAAWTQMASALA